VHGCGGSVVLVEPFGAGGGVDVIASALAEWLAQVWAVPVMVENRPGLGATAAPAFVAAAAADGRTLLINTSAHAYSAALATGLPYDPISDFVAIAPVTSQSYVLVASERSDVRGLGALIGAAQARSLTFISAGVGTGTHLSVVELNLGLGISATHLPARPTDAISATIARLVAGEADYAMCPIPIAQPHLAHGSLIALVARRSYTPGSRGRGLRLPHLVRHLGAVGDSGAPREGAQRRHRRGTWRTGAAILAQRARRPAHADDTPGVRGLRHQRA
jgi:tripartite-type tricarboxylate transporter receptor subunit TctC